MGKIIDSTTDMYVPSAYVLYTYVHRGGTRAQADSYVPSTMCVVTREPCGRQTEKRNVRWRGRKRKNGRPMHVNACCHKHGNEAEGSGSRVRTWTRSFAYVCVANENG